MRHVQDELLDALPLHFLQVGALSMEVDVVKVLAPDAFSVACPQVDLLGWAVPLFAGVNNSLDAGLLVVLALEESAAVEAYLESHFDDGVVEVSKVSELTAVEVLRGELKIHVVLEIDGLLDLEPALDQTLVPALQHH